MGKFKGENVIRSVFNYRVTKVLGDTDFVDLKMIFAPYGQIGGDFIY